MRSGQHHESELLAGLEVFDLTNSVAGRFCTRLMADYGANVVQVEWKESSTGVRAESDRSASQVMGHSANHRHLRGNKRIVRLSAGSTAEGKDAFSSVAGLIDNADVVVGGSGPTRAAVRERSGRIITCGVSDFGESGPYRDWHGSEMIHQALSGTMFVTGEATRKPLYGVGHRAYYAAGVTAFNGIMAALLERNASGLGQDVEVSVFESTAAMGQNFTTHYRYSGGMQRRGRYPTPLTTLRCEDGWVVLFALRRWPAVCQVFNLQELECDKRFADVTDRIRNWDEAVSLLQEQAGTMSAKALVDAGQRHKVSISRVMDPESLWTSPHLRERRFWWCRPNSSGRPSLGPVFRVGPANEPTEERRAHSSGEDANRKGTRPLDGVRVLDFTIAWAGPMATRILAFLGAQVIKIEAPGKMDSWRGPRHGANPDRYPGSDFGARPYNRNCYFNTQNHDKYSIGIDLKRTGAKEIVHRLAADCDVVVANFSPGTLDRLGVGYEALRKVRPDLIMLEMPAYGTSGRYAHFVGMGQNIESMTGMSSLFGYEEGAPGLTGSAFLDPAGGFHGAAAVLAGLYARSADGRGRYIELAQREAAMHWIGEYLLDWIDTGSCHRSTGNSSASAAPHDAFECRGEDEWIAIAVFNDEQFEALVQVLGADGLSRDTRFRSVASRCEHAGELDPLLRQLTRSWDKRDLATRLQEVGVHAAPVANGSEVANDPHLRERGFFTTLAHPDAGTHEYPGLPMRLSETPGRIERAAPCFGQHGREILTELMGLKDEEIDELVKSSVVSFEPYENAAF